MTSLRSTSPRQLSGTYYAERGSVCETQFHYFTENAASATQIALSIVLSRFG